MEMTIDAPSEQGASPHHFWIKDAQIREFVGSTLFSELSGNAIKLYLKLLSYGNSHKKPYVYPKYADLCDSLGINRKTLQAAVDELQHAALVDQNPGCGRSNSEYYFKEVQDLKPFESRKQKKASEQWLHPKASTSDPADQSAALLGASSSQSPVTKDLSPYPSNLLPLTHTDSGNPDEKASENEVVSDTKPSDDALIPLDSVIELFSSQAPAKNGRPQKLPPQPSQILPPQPSQILPPLNNNIIIKQNTTQQTTIQQELSTLLATLHHDPDSDVGGSVVGSVVDVLSAFVVWVEKFGLTASSCRKILSEYPKTNLELQAIRHAFESQQKSIRNPSGWLRSALVGDYDLQEAIDAVSLENRHKQSKLKQRSIALEREERIEKLVQKDNLEARQRLTDENKAYLEAAKLKLKYDYTFAETIAKKRCSDKGYKEGDDLYDGLYNLFLRQALSKMLSG